jgi:hypothetical protein
MNLLSFGTEISSLCHILIANLMLLDDKMQRVICFTEVGTEFATNMAAF